jgi:uncharacterized protein YciI
VTGSSPMLARFYVVFMTTKYGSMAEVRERAPELMAAHLARSRELHAEGVLVLAGAFLDRPEEPVRTMGVFTSRAAAEDYAQQDPFVRAGMVDGWEIREWANMLV